MANEIGTTLLNTLTNSSFDIGNMAKVLAEADVAGPRSLVDKSETKANTELSALKYLETNITAFQSYLSDLSTPGLFQSRQAESSDESVFTVQTNGVPVTGSYQIESLQTAKAHTMVANKTYSSASDLISTGTLAISVAGQTQNIVIDNTNNTLEGLQNIINNGDYGVNASIINNGGNYQIMFSSKNTGSASEISLSGLADFDVDGLTTTTEAQNAVMNINGLNIANSTNNFSEVIDGLDIKLNSASPGVTQGLTVSTDSEKITSTVSDFVDVYNQMHSILDDLGSYRELTEDEQNSEDYAYFGDLAGSSLLRDLKEQLRSSLSGAIPDLSDPNTLAAVGISFDLKGKLSLDSSVLDNLVSSNIDALSRVFSKGGQTTDPLMKVVGGSEETLAGTYSVDVSQLAERASVAGTGVTYAANEYRAAGTGIYDPVAASTIESGAAFQISFNSGASSTVNFTAGAYSSKDLVASQMQSDINSQTGQSVSVAYDSTQGRFEVSNSTGTIDISGASLMENQGFSAANYTSEQLINLASDASFDVSIDGSTSATANISADKYTLSELAEKMRSSINNLSEVSSTGASVNISTSGGALTLSSDRFGNSSNVSMTNFTNLANAGLTTDLTDAGQNVDGTITTASGSLSLGAYADSSDGRKIKISDFAVIGTSPAEVRGLEFDVLGGAIGSRGDVVFSQGFASRINETIGRLLDSDNGLVSDRMDSLTKRLSEYSDKNDKLDARYEQMLSKYQLQFSSLQSLLSSTQQTSDFLTATFSNNNNN